MYKWHVHSAIGRGRPFANDFAKVADGIASSLRQFSISVSRCAENNDGPSIINSSTRSQKSAEAFKEVSSLPKSRGIDARSLGAKPPSAPTSFRITRIGDQSQTGDGTNIINTRSGFAPRAGSNMGGAGRGGSGFRPRQGGAGRGGLGARGRGRGRGARKPPGQREKREKSDGDEYAPVAYSEEERAYLDMSEGGFPTDYQPETSAASLARYGPAVMSSPRGIQESVVNRIMVATDNKDPSFEHASMHLARIDEGLGTFFEDAEQRALTEKFQGGKARSLTADQKRSIMKQWVAGRYMKLKTPEEGNVLALARQMARRNDTYLPEDRIKFDKTLKSLLPTNMLEALYQKHVVPHLPNPYRRKKYMKAPFEEASLAADTQSEDMQEEYIETPAPQTPATA